MTTPTINVTTLELAHEALAHYADLDLREALKRTAVLHLIPVHITERAVEEILTIPGADTMSTRDLLSHVARDVPPSPPEADYLSRTTITLARWALSRFSYHLRFSAALRRAAKQMIMPHSAAEQAVEEILTIIPGALHMSTRDLLRRAVLAEEKTS